MPKEVKITLQDDQAKALAVLAGTQACGGKDLADVLAHVADHLTQGVVRPGSWERNVVNMLFGGDWEARMEIDPQDPWHLRPIQDPTNN